LKAAAARRHAHLQAREEQKKLLDRWPFVTKHESMQGERTRSYQQDGGAEAALHVAKLLREDA
jgi:hypothetical protein